MPPSPAARTVVAGPRPGASSGAPRRDLRGTVLSKTQRMTWRHIPKQSQCSRLVRMGDQARTLVYCDASSSPRAECRAMTSKSLECTPRSINTSSMTSASWFRNSCNKTQADIHPGHSLRHTHAPVHASTHDRCMPQQPRVWQPSVRAHRPLLCHGTHRQLFRQRRFALFRHGQIASQNRDSDGVTRAALPLCVV